MANKLAPQFAKETDLFKTNEVILSGNFSTGQIYTREPSVFANNIAEKLGIEELKNRGIGGNANNIPYFITDGTAAGIVKHIALGGLISEAQKTAFNKDFGGTGGDAGTSSNVARYDHDHDSLKNGCSGVWTFTGVTSYTIDIDDLKAKMRYAARDYVNPAVTYKLWTLGDTSPYSLTDEEKIASITSKLQTSVTAGDTFEFDEITFTGLTSSKTYSLYINWIDDGGLFVAASGV